MNRWFLRCPDCLSVVAIDADKAPAETTCAVCDICMEHLGRVERDRLVKDEFRCPCDDRCTCASGPNCSCRCGGKNHGSGLVVTVQVDAGGIPKVCPPDAHAPARRDEWRKAYQAALDGGPNQGAYRRKLGGEFLSRDEFADYLEHAAYIRRVHKVRGMRTHHGRMKAIARLTGKDPDKSKGCSCDHPHVPSWSQPMTESPRPVAHADVRVGEQVGLLG